MKLPIHLNIESDSIWTEYKSERNRVENVDQLKTFVKRWSGLFTNVVQEQALTDEVLAKVKTEKIDSSPNRIRELAYFKWEQAGRPINDGTEFWLSAENEVNYDCNLIAELVVPVVIIKAMMAAKQFIVPLNCAFIQMNGGLGEFED